MGSEFGFFKLVGWNREKRSIGQWSHNLKFNQKQVLQTTLQGKVGTLVGFFEFDFGFRGAR
jgi:hypothetical protein